MRLKNTIKVIFASFATTYKLLLYKLIVLAVLATVGYFVIVPNFKYLIIDSHIKDLVISGADVVTSIFTGVPSVTEARVPFTTALQGFREYIAGDLSGIIWLLVVLMLLFVVGGFFNNLANYATGEVVDDHMSSLSHKGFVVSIFKNLGKSSIYSLIEVGVSFLSFAIGTAFFLLIYITLFDVIGVVAVFFGIIIYIFCFAIKNSFLSDFMPEIIAGSGIKKAFKESLKLKSTTFVSVLSNYVTIGLFVMYMNVSFAICTFFAGLIVTLPLSTIIITSFKMVNYYTNRGKKFFISHDEIITPKVAKEDLELIKNLDD